MSAIDIGTAAFIGIAMVAALAAFWLCVRSIDAEWVELDH